MKQFIPFLTATVLAGCALPPGTFTPSTMNAPLVQGPPIEDVVSSFDDALTCLRGQIPAGVAFAVGQVTDATGKETFAEGGTGKFVTQGAGEMVQSALFRAGVTVVNRRDWQISATEANWGIRDIRRQVPVNFFVSGSINSLDFIPGGGFSAQVAGVGPRYRQNRILVALDLTLTDAYTGRIVANVPLQKQIFTREMGVGANTFFGKTLIQFDAGGMEREALHFTLRQMLTFATFEVLGQLMKPEVFDSCRAQVVKSEGMVNTVGTADREALSAAVRAAQLQEASPPAPGLAMPVSRPDASAEERAAAQQVAGEVALLAARQRAIDAQQLPGPSGQPNGGAAQEVGATPVAQRENTTGNAGQTPQQRQAAAIGQESTKFATDAIRQAASSEAAKTRTDAVRLAAGALQKSNDALRLLQRAAQMGFSGDEGEVAAVVVQQALEAAKRAGTAAAAREPDVKRAEGEAAERKAAEREAAEREAAEREAAEAAMTKTKGAAPDTDGNAQPPATTAPGSSKKPLPLGAPL